MSGGILGKFDLSTRNFGGVTAFRTFWSSRLLIFLACPAALLQG